MAPGVNFRGDRIDPIAVAIERAQKALYIGLHIWLNLQKCIRGYIKRGFHRAVITPEAHRASCGVVAAALIRETDGHICLYPLIRLPRETHHRAFAGVALVLKVACVREKAVPVIACDEASAISCGKSLNGASFDSVEVSM